MNKHAREYFAKICRKNGDAKSARRYEEGLYNSLGAINMDVLDNLLAEVQRLREEKSFLLKHINQTNVWLKAVMKNEIKE